MNTRTGWMVVLLGVSSWWQTGPHQESEAGRSAGPSHESLPSFTDVTEGAGIAFTHFRGDSGRKYMVETFGSGAAFFDYDRDGWLDLYLVNGAPLPGHEASSSPVNTLYRNNGDGTFTDVTAAAGVGDPGYGMGCAVADYDNDGFLDLYLTNFGPDVLFRNNGDGTFSDRTRDTGLGCDLWGSSSGFGDIDGDGDLDLYVANYIDFSFANHKPCLSRKGLQYYCHPSIYDGVADVMYRNNGDGTFTNITRAAGMDISEGRGLGVVFGDYDNDGDADIYVANDTVRNNLWRNRGDGTFEDVALLSGVAFNESGRAEGGMGVDFGDFDNDGALDIFVTNYELESNTIYRATGRELFADVTYISGMGVPSLPYVGFGTAFVDYDNDRELDVFIANGHIMETAGPDVDDVVHEQPNLLFRNNGRGRFEDVSLESGAHFSTRRSSRGAAFADYDNDGDIDVVVTNSNAAPNLLRNDGGNQRHKLMVEAVGQESNRDGVGARLLLTPGGLSQLREVHGAYGYCSHNDLRVVVGLDASPTVERLEVRWPSGLVETFENIAADQWIVIKEGIGIIQKKRLVSERR